MDEMNWVENAIWIGGASCSGKSTVADHIGIQTGLGVVHLDDWLGDILETSDPESMPAMNWYRTVGSANWFKSATIEDCERYISALREEMEASLHKLGTVVKSPTIVEGSCFFPDMVNDLSPAGMHVWVVGTDHFREQMYKQRDWAVELTNSYKNPTAAWHNWMTRDSYQAEYIRKSAVKLEMGVIEHDGSQSVESVAGMVSTALNL